MSGARYEFTTRWRFRATPEEIADVLADPLDLPRWWPSVYLAAREASPAGADGLGRSVELHTRGWLPYTLRWTLRVVRRDYPRGFAITATGDFEGVGVWTIAPDGRDVDATFEWQVTAHKPILRLFSFAFRPIFAANHRWAMRQGESSLRRELSRRREVAAAAQSAGE